MQMVLLYLFGIVWPAVHALDNGLARTPPMGWLSWERFRCNIDCDHDPDNCISENLYKAMADRMVSDGYKDAGYQYVNIDDCWQAMQRDKSGKLVADPKRFPSGIKALSDYMHQRGLKLGIYEDFGTKTCGGYPGSEYYLQMDANTFAEWQVDSLKLDGCYSDPKQYDDAYPAMSQWLNRTNRAMIFSCSWPAYQEGSGIKPNYPRIAQYCNIWRNYDDIQDSWDSLSGIINFYGDDHTNFSEAAGPGNFNDPDMLIIGGFGLSYDQQRVQMAMWSIMASPLLMSADLRNMKPESKALLLNRAAIRINQDPMGRQGKRIMMSGHIQIWTRPVMPTGSVAFAFLNFGTGGMPATVSATLNSMGMTRPGGYNITDVFTSAGMGSFRPSQTFSTKVNPTGVFFGLAMPL